MQTILETWVSPWLVMLVHSIVKKNGSNTVRNYFVKTYLFNLRMRELESTKGDVLIYVSPENRKRGTADTFEMSI